MLNIEFAGTAEIDGCACSSCGVAIPEGGKLHFLFNADVRNQRDQVVCDACATAMPVTDSLELWDPFTFTRTELAGAQSTFRSHVTPNVDLCEVIEFIAGWGHCGRINSTEFDFQCRAGYRDCDFLLMNLDHML